MVFVSPAMFDVMHVSPDYMPTFDLVLLLQKMDKVALKSALKRNAQYIFQTGGTIREMENLGFREMPYKITVEGKTHRECHYFIIKYDASYEMRTQLSRQFKLDRDVIRAASFRIAKNPIELHTPQCKNECTVYQDNLPPPLRPSIIEIHKRIKQKEEEKKKKDKFPLSNVEDKQFLIF